MSTMNTFQKQTEINILSTIPCSFSPNEIKTITIGNKNARRDIHLLFFGNYEKHEFTSADLTPEKVKKIICVHDAPHSVALYLQEKDNCDIALHSHIPFSFPTTLDYTIDFTQRDNYPLVVLVYGNDTTMELEKNGVPTMFRRWCARIYKIEMARFVYKHFGFNGVTQVKGMTKHQSSKRNKLDPNHSIDPMAIDPVTKKTKRFKVYQKLPIFNMTEKEQLVLMAENGLVPSKWFEVYGVAGHGCMFCPYKSEEYWFKLASEHPKLYTQCNDFRLAGSHKDLPKEYHYYRKSRIM